MESAGQIVRSKIGRITNRTTTRHRSASTGIVVRTTVLEMVRRRASLSATIVAHRP